MHNAFDVIIIGGGFYGCSIALQLRQLFPRVLIIEQEADLLRHASRFNQARVHNGYHYPRNLVTAYRSAVNYPRFISEFHEAVQEDFTSLYAIPRQFSLVNGQQFYRIYHDLHVPIEAAPESITALFNPDLIESVFVVKEAVFNSEILKEKLKTQLQRTGIEVWYNQAVEKVSSNGHELILETTQGESCTAQYAFNCTYSQINTLLHRSGLPALDFKHEITELAVVNVPAPLQHMGVTVMDGLFFSLMPFPSRQAHSLSHVRYTPHQSWSDRQAIVNPDSFIENATSSSHFPYMVKDAQRYLPSLERAKYVDSFFEVKTVLAQNEIDDGRPILFKQNYGLPNFFIIMGGKIDNVYDVLARLEEVFPQ